jgi:hypothetical protein
VFRATTAGALYPITVFLIGFILGTIRVLLLAPHLGETTAVLVEAPTMLVASWFVCRWWADRLDVMRTVPARSLMGFVAFLVLMSAEAGLGAGVRSIAHRSACHLRIGGWSDWSGRSGGLRHVPGHSGLAAVGQSEALPKSGLASMPLSMPVASIAARVFASGSVMRIARAGSVFW